MKLIHKLLCLPMVLLALAFTACDRDYDAPVLNEPQYSLPDGAQTITINELRQKYAAATQDNAMTIEEDLYLHARINGDDRSGNIYKQIYIQDETGAISFLVDQSDVYNEYAAGQEIFVELKGLCVSVYGKEQQIGHPDGYLYRTPYENFKEHVHKNAWADESKIEVKEFDNISRISDNTEANKFTLVKLTGVHFAEAGQANFAESNGYGEHDLVDAYGNTLLVRTSNYADFAAKKLPSGTGTVVGVLGRFNGKWQLTIRSYDDVQGFDSETPDEPSTPDEPTVEGTPISIADLRTKYAAATKDTPITIDEDLALVGVIGGNDISGNIFKQIYVQDETGGISIQIDQYDIYKDYALGQKVIVNLKGFSVSTYGEEYQINKNGNRIPYSEFQEAAKKSGAASESNIVVKEYNNFDEINVEQAKGTVVRLKNVHFQKGGQETFAPEKENANKTLLDVNGKSLVVRNSGYSDFYSKTLPTGTGTLVGVLSVFNGTAQLFLRSYSDVQGFDGVTPDTPDTPNQPSDPIDGDVIFSEDFGASVEKVGSNWPSLDIFTGWTSGLTFTDPDMVAGGYSYSSISVRQTSALNPHAWFAANKNGTMNIEGFDTTGYTELQLTYDITANGSGNQNVIKVYVDNTEITVPSADIATKNEYQTVTLTNLPTGFKSLSFKSAASTNTIGYRIDNIKLIGKK